MTLRIAINGYGRIGRCVLRALYENNYDDRIEIVSMNNITSIEASAHLTKYDSTHGVFDGDVTFDHESITVRGDRLHAHKIKDPEKLPWKEEGVDIVLECSGIFNDGKKASAHIRSGAKKVLISAPAPNVDQTIVYGVNHKILKKDDVMISNASCTTNCLAPIAMVLNKSIGIETGLMNTIHSVTNDQILLDARHSDLRRARSATQSMIPTKTGAAKTVGLVLPELEGKLDGLSVRVPTMNVSLVDFTFTSKRNTTVEEVNALLVEASQTSLKGILTINSGLLVSIDFNHNPSSAIFDVTQTKVLGRTVKILAWYDNEWGFANRMLDVALQMFK